MKNVIIFLSIFLLFSIFVGAESICQNQGGQCYWGECPYNMPIPSGGEELCDDSDIGGIGVGAAIVDITGLTVQGDVCCLPSDYEGGDEDNLEDQMEEIINENNILLVRNNIGGKEVLDFDDDSCCAEEGDTPEGFQDCCDGMPLNEGVCGCPDGFVWRAFRQECEYQPRRCGYIEEREENVCETFLDILSNCLAHYG